MDKRWDITVEEKTKILCWKEEGVSTVEIATRLGRHPAGVQRQYVVLKKLPPMTPPLSIKKRLVGIRKITLAMKSRLKQEVLRNTFKSARELKKEVPGWDNLFGLDDPACPAEAVGVVVQGCRQEAPADPGDGQEAPEVLP